MKQADVVNWYVRVLNEEGAFESVAEMASEFRQVRAIIQVNPVFLLAIILAGDSTNR
jgi:hypothetical protein